jgi:transcription antitermination factor NusA-like protein
MNEELKLLLTIDDRIIAEDIQNLLEESEIFTILVSDNPASSILTTYSGLNPVESIEIQINSKDYDQAIKILIDSSYKDLLVI